MWSRRRRSWRTMSAPIAKPSQAMQQRRWAYTVTLHHIVYVPVHVQSALVRSGNVLRSDCLQAEDSRAATAVTKDAGTEENAGGEVAVRAAVPAQQGLQYLAALPPGMTPASNRCPGRIAMLLCTIATCATRLRRNPASFMLSTEA